MRSSLQVKALALAFLMFGSCKSAPAAKTDLLSKQTSWAVATIFAKKSVALPESMSTPAALATKSEAAGYLAHTMTDQEEKLKSLFKDALRPMDTATNAASYAKLPQKWDNASYVGGGAFRPLHMEEPKAMGAFATELGVDAVILIRHDLAMVASPMKVELDMSHMKFSQWRATDQVTVVVISNKGEVLLDSNVASSGINPKVENVAQKLGEDLAPISDKIMQQAVEDAMLSGLDAALRDLRNNLR